MTAAEMCYPSGSVCCPSNCRARPSNFTCSPKAGACDIADYCSFGHCNDTRVAKGIYYLLLYFITFCFILIVSFLGSVCRAKNGTCDIAGMQPLSNSYCIFLILCRNVWWRQCRLPCRLLQCHWLCLHILLQSKCTPPLLLFCFIQFIF